MFISSRHPSTTPLPCGEIPSFPPRSSTHLHPSTQPFYKNSFFPPKTLAEICVLHDNTLHLQTDISSFCCTSKHYNKGALNLLLHQPSSMKFRHLLPFLCSWFVLVGFCIKTQAQNFVSSSQNAPTLSQNTSANIAQLHVDLADTLTLKDVHAAQKTWRRTKITLTSAATPTLQSLEEEATQVGSSATRNPIASSSTRAMPS